MPIVAVNIIELFNVSKELMIYGAKNILIEKLMAVQFSKKLENYMIFQLNIELMFILFIIEDFSSILTLEKNLKDGGIKSISFEFSEWSNEIKILKY